MDGHEVEVGVEAGKHGVNRAVLILHDTSTASTTRDRKQVSNLRCYNKLQSAPGWSRSAPADAGRGSSYWRTDRAADQDQAQLTLQSKRTGGHEYM